MGHETIYIDFMGHENSKKSVPWTESHPDIYVLMISWMTHEFGAINTNIALRSSQGLQILLMSGVSVTSTSQI